jgi:serralysin
MAIFTGDESNDTFIGTQDADEIYGNGGNDQLHGAGGNDLIDGGDGFDNAYGGDGDDSIHGGLSDDWLRGENGNDALYGDDGVDILQGGAGLDTLYGGDGDDIIFGDGGDDILYGEAGDDDFDINDRANIDDGNDTLYGGDGIDTLYLYRSIDSYIVEEIEGGYKITSSNFVYTLHDVEQISTGGQVYDVASRVGAVPGDTTDDIPGNPTTTVTLTPGQTVTSNIGFTGDIDFFEVQLVAGQSYIFTLDATGGTPLGDPYLNLYGSNGVTLIAFDDDNGGNLNSELRFTATESGTFYLSAEAWSTETGGYEISMLEVPSQDPLDTIDWGTQVSGQSLTVYFAFLGESFQFDYGDGSFESFTATNSWSQIQIDKVLAALGEYSDYINISFSQTMSSESADFIILLDSGLGGLGAAGLMSTPPGSPALGVFDPAAVNSSWLDPGGFGFALILHEFGHGLGLAHPHDDGGSSEIMEGMSIHDPFTYGVAGLNQGVFTIMSYNDGYPSLGNGQPVSPTTGYQATPMALDIALLQEKYGAVEASTGDTVYALEDVIGRYESIWDTGGADTISYSGTSAVVIDLRAATLLNEEGGGGRLSYLGVPWAMSTPGGYTIANGVIIENATGGSGNDLLFGNEFANVLIGGSGNDEIDGLGGNDHLQGGDGDDTLRSAGGTVIFDGGAGTDTVDLSRVNGPLNIDLSVAGPQGGFTFIGVERLIGSEFNDILRGSDAALNRFVAGGGDDLIIATIDDIIFGGAGVDTLTYINASSGVTVALKIGPLQLEQSGGMGLQAVSWDIEIVVGSNFDDNISGWDNFLSDHSGAGADTFYGGAGNDVLRGFSGPDTLYGEDGNDALFGGTKNDVLYGGEGDDILYGEDGDDYMLGGAGNDQLYGGLGNDTLFGQAGANWIEGRAGNDILVGGDEYDAMDGGEGDDILYGEDGDDYMLGGAGNDQLYGGLGNDTLFGGLGADYLSGGAGDDVFAFLSGDGADIISDFAAGNSSGDIIYLLGLGWDEFADVQAGASQQGSDVLIDLGAGNSITLLGVTLADLNAGDFGFG